MQKKHLHMGVCLSGIPEAGIANLTVQEYGADEDRFEKESSFCIVCGFWIRYCAEVKKKNAAGFVDCGSRQEIRFAPEIAATERVNCKECFELCPTLYLQAAFVQKTLDFPDKPKFIL